jgi:spore coat protein U-like protein
MTNQLSLRLVLATFSLLGLFYIPNSYSASSGGCSITAVSAFSFGTYDVFSLIDTTGTASFSVSGCINGGRTYVATLSTGSANVYSPRQMSSGSNRLDYNLYTDLTYTTIWGSGSGGTSSVSSTNNGASTTTHFIYGKMIAGQDAAVGTYSDSIIITITF